MQIVITVLAIIALFILGAWFVGAASKCHANRNHGAFGIGVMFSVITIIALFKAIISI